MSYNQIYEHTMHLALPIQVNLVAPSFSHNVSQFWANNAPFCYLASLTKAILR